MAADKIKIGARNENPLEIKHEHTRAHTWASAWTNHVKNTCVFQMSHTKNIDAHDKNKFFFIVLGQGDNKQQCGINSGGKKSISRGRSGQT